MKSGIKDRMPALRALVGARNTVEVSIFCALAAMTALSAAIVKEARHMPPLASVQHVAPTSARATPAGARVVPVVRTAAPAPEIVEPTPAESARAARMIERVSAETRWFDGRPARPARVIWMQVTAYSPDERSCGEFADGLTASLHSVQTNGGALVAADTRLFPFGTMLSIEGYHDGQIVPVLDRGGAIKGHHIDLLMPTHAQAMGWGDQRMPVIVWEYADGKPAVDPRKLR